MFLEIGEPTLEGILPQGGIKAVNISPVEGSSVVATGGADGSVVVFDVGAGRIASHLKGHTKKVNSECFCRLEERSVKCPGLLETFISQRHHTNG